MTFFKRRDTPTITERTISALVSGAATKVHVDREHDNPNINGMYIPKKDQIVLFRCKGDIPALAVALEEAGHSLMRDDYLKYEKRAGDITQRLMQWHPSGTALLDWLEDSRVYKYLKDEYPGAHGELDFVWERRRDSLKDKGWDTSKMSPEEKQFAARSHELANELLKVVDEYQAGEHPKSYTEILDRLEKFAKSAPQTYPLPRPILIIGIAGPVDGPLPKGAAQLPATEMPALAGTVTIVYLGGLQPSQVDYDWPVIDRAVISVATGGYW